MILVALLTIEQKNEIVGQLFCEDSYFNPIQDFYENWIISTQETDHCDHPQFSWVKDLPLIEYVPKIYPPIN